MVDGGMRTHPAADVLPMQSEEEFAALVELIAEHGQQRPIVVDAEGRVVDGRNRWKACQVLGLDPVVEPLGDRDPWVLSENENGASRSLSTGQKAMRRALTLAAQGRRKNGRWERGSLDNPTSWNIDSAWREAMKRAGLVIDVANRAEALTPGDGIPADSRDFYLTLPQKVLSGDVTLAYAHSQANQYEAQAVMAELQLWRPLNDRIDPLEHLASDLDGYMPLPVIDAPMTKHTKDRIAKVAKDLAAAAAELRNYLKENR